MSLGRGQSFQQRGRELFAGSPELKGDELAASLIDLPQPPVLLMSDGVLAVETRQHDPGDIRVTVVMSVEGHRRGGYLGSRQTLMIRARVRSPSRGQL